MSLKKEGKKEGKKEKKKLTLIPRGQYFAVPWPAIQFWSFHLLDPIHMGSANSPKGPYWIHSIRWRHCTSSSFHHEALLQQRNIGLDQSELSTVGGGGCSGGGCIGTVGVKAGGVTPGGGEVRVSVTPPRVAARRVSALSRGESVQELDVSTIGVGMATMVVNRAGSRTRRWRKWFMIECWIKRSISFPPSW